MLIPLLQHMFLQQISKRKISSYFMCLIRHFFVQIGDVDSKSVYIIFSQFQLYSFCRTYNRGVLILRC
jgi:hypothetical protein